MNLANNTTKLEEYLMAMNETEQYHLQRLVEKFIRNDPVRRHASLRQCTSLIRRTAALTCNEHKVWTKLEAVETKLRIDGQDAAAGFLRQRVEYLVPPPSPEMLETERLHYAVLDLLLHMMPSLNPAVMSRVIAQSQLAQELARRREQSKPPPMTAAEVYQGLEPYAPPTYAPSSPGSPRSVSSSSLSDNGDHDRDPNMGVGSDDPMHRHSFGNPVPPPADPLPWLTHLAALQYWRRAPTSLPFTTFSAHDPHTLAFANAHHTSINTPADPVPFPAAVVTEADLVRECILALRRMPTWMFALTSDGKLRIARRVAVTHLAIDTLSAVLAQVARVASKLLSVHEFAAHPNNRHASDPVLAAFVLGVQMELDALDSELSKLEAGLQHALLWQQQSAGPRKASLISLNRRIPHLTEFVVALGDFLDASTNSLVSGTTLLDRLVDQLSASQLSSLFPNWLRLFLATFSAHCVQLDRWLNEGQVLTPDSFFIRTVPPPSPDAAATGAANDTAQEYDVWRHGFLVDTSNTPRMFPPNLVDRMLVIGKSVALSRTASSSSSVHMLTLAKDIDATSFSPPPPTSSTTYYSAFAAHLHSLVMDPVTCPLPSLLTQSRRLAPADIRLSRPIAPILADCATAALQPYLTHSAHIVSRFIAMYRIDAHLRLVSSVYLMENGAEWTVALAPVFKRIKRRRTWASHDVVQETIGAAVARMRVVCGLRVGDNAGGMQVGIVQGRTALSGVYASYRPSWPINLIVTAGHVDMYNRVMTVLMYLRQAKYMLEDEAYVAIRRLRSREWDNVLGLRFLLVHFVNAVEAFWMVGVIDAERHALRERMRRSQTVDALIEAHDAFVNRVVDLMLLRTTPLSDAIGQAFGLCSEFAAVFDHLIWSQFVDRETTQAVVEWKPKLVARFKDIYERFTAIRRFLVTSLDIMATKGNVVHLESLLYALSTESDGGLLWQ